MKQTGAIPRDMGNQPGSARALAPAVRLRGD